MRSDFLRGKIIEVPQCAKCGAPAPSNMTTSKQILAWLRLHRPECPGTRRARG